MHQREGHRAAIAAITDLAAMGVVLVAPGVELALAAGAAVTTARPRDKSDAGAYVVQRMAVRESARHQTVLAAVAARATLGILQAAGGMRFASSAAN